jgi:hypothetical protein
MIEFELARTEGIPIMRPEGDLRPLTEQKGYPATSGHDQQL